MSTPQVPLGEVAEFINGVAFKPEDWGEEGRKIIRIQNLNSGSRAFNRTLRSVPDKFIVRPGDLLVSWSATLGVYQWTDQEDGLLNQHIFRVLPREQTDKNYLRHCLSSALSRMEAHLHGATMKHINRGEFLGTKVPLPPLVEQRRIAAILDQAEELRAKRRAAIALLDQLPQAIFLEMFGDPATNPKGWETKPLKAVTTKIGSGSTPLGGESAYKTEGIALIRSMNIHDGQFVPKGLAYIDEVQAAKLSNVVVAPNDVLLNITGASVARVALVPSDVLPARVNQHVSILRCAHSLCPRFLESLFINPSTKKNLLRVAGAGATREAITKEQLEAFQIPLPPTETQELFAERVEAIRHTKAAHQSSLVELDVLLSSLQADAFEVNVQSAKELSHV